MALTTPSCAPRWRPSRRTAAGSSTHTSTTRACPYSVGADALMGWRPLLTRRRTPPPPRAAARSHPRSSATPPRPPGAARRGPAGTHRDPSSRSARPDSCPGVRPRRSSTTMGPWSRSLRICWPLRVHSPYAGECQQADGQRDDACPQQLTFDELLSRLESRGHPSLALKSEALDTDHGVRSCPPSRLDWIGPSRCGDDRIADDDREPGRALCL